MDLSCTDIAEVSSFYGPGSIIAWLTSVAIVLVRTHYQQTEPKFHLLEVITIVWYPLVAFVDSSRRLAVDYDPAPCQTYVAVWVQVVAYALQTLFSGAVYGFGEAAITMDLAFPVWLSLCLLLGRILVKATAIWTTGATLQKVIVGGVTPALLWVVFKVVEFLIPPSGSQTEFVIHNLWIWSQFCFLNMLCRAWFTLTDFSPLIAIPSLTLFWFINVLKYIIWKRARARSIAWVVNCVFLPAILLLGVFGGNALSTTELPTALIFHQPSLLSDWGQSAAIPAAAVLSAIVVGIAVSDAEDR